MDTIKISDVINFLTSRLEYAQAELAERCKNGTDFDVRYWANYRDGVEGTLRAFKKSFVTEEG